MINNPKPWRKRPVINSPPSKATSFSANNEIVVGHIAIRATSLLEQWLSMRLPHPGTETIYYLLHLGPVEA